MPPRTKVTTRLQCLDFLTSQEDFYHTCSRMIIFNVVCSYCQRQQQLQAKNPGIRDSCRNLPWFLRMGPKEKS